MTVMVNGENYAIVAKIKKFTSAGGACVCVMYEMLLSCYICGLYTSFPERDIIPG